MGHCWLRASNWLSLYLAEAFTIISTTRKIESFIRFWNEQRWHEQFCKHWCNQISHQFVVFYLSRSCKGNNSNIKSINKQTLVNFNIIQKINICRCTKTQSFFKKDAEDVLLRNIKNIGLPMKLEQMQLNVK